ncbi:MAG: hypothetical protein QXX79_00085 [Candidatus Bathyarchaeia archaeon]
MNANVELYIARVEEACGAERDFIVLFKYDKKDEAVAKILKKAKIVRTITGILDLAYRDVSFRLYVTGKAIFKKIKDKNELNEILADLLS